MLGELGLTNRHFNLHEIQKRRAKRRTVAKIGKCEENNEEFVEIFNSFRELPEENCFLFFSRNERQSRLLLGVWPHTESHAGMPFAVMELRGSLHGASSIN